MKITMNIVKIGFFALYVVATSGGVPNDHWAMESCLKEVEIPVTYQSDPYQYTCFRKCIWEKQGVIEHNRINFNSPKLKNLLDHDTEKLEKFENCLKESLPNMIVLECADLATVHFCYIKARGKAKSLRILTLLYMINKLIGAVINPIAEKGAEMFLFGLSGKNPQDYIQETSTTEPDVILLLKDLSTKSISELPNKNDEFNAN